MAEIPIRRSIATRKRARHAPLLRGRDAVACLTIAPTSLAIAAVLAWWGATLVPQAGYSWLVGGLVVFWAAAFLVIAVRASNVVLRALTSRTSA